MSRYYSDPSREHEAYSLPDVEVFYDDALDEPSEEEANSEPPKGPGFYWWFCFPGCLPDSEPFGPFDTKEEAIAHMREWCEWFS